MYPVDPSLDGFVMVKEIDIPRSSPVVRDEALVSFWSLIFGVSRQHALQAHADRFYVLNGRPALVAE